EADHLPRGRSPSPQEAKVVATPLGAASRHRHRDKPGEDGARKAEKEEEHLGVEGVGARGVESGAQVVADQTGTSQTSLDVVRPAGDVREGGRRVGGETVDKADVDLRTDEVGTNRGQGAEGALPGTG